MSDYDSSLPVRTETAGDVVSKICDGASVSNLLEVDGFGHINVNLFDGAAESITSQASGGQQALDVGVCVAGTQVDPRDVRALTNADVVTAEQGTDPWTVDITDIAGAAPGATNALPSRLTDGSAFYDARDIRALTASDIVVAQIKDSAGLSIDLGQQLEAASVPVVLASDQPAIPVYESSPGTGVISYATSAAVAAAASVNHDYSVTALKTLKVSGIEASASGKLKMEVKAETAPSAGTYNTLFVMFNSTASPNLSIKLSDFVSQVAGAKIRITLTNLDKAAEDVYSTLIGHEI